MSKEGESCSQTSWVGGGVERALKKAGRIVRGGEGMVKAWTDSPLHHLPAS